MRCERLVPLGGLLLCEHPSQGGTEVAKTSTPCTRGRTGPHPPGGRSQPGECVGLLWASRVMLRIKHGQTVTILMSFLRPERPKVLIIDARLPSFPLSASDDLRGRGGWSGAVSHPRVPSRWPACAGLGGLALRACALCYVALSLCHEGHWTRGRGWL